MTELSGKPGSSAATLPVEIVLHPSWWHKHTGMTFDEDFFFNPSRRVEAERAMESALYERWGEYGLGEHKDEDLPVVGPVHLAAGFIISEMLGCRVDYLENAPPQVICAEGNNIPSEFQLAFESPVFKKFQRLLEALKTKYGYVVGDVNWGGILNVALDLWGQDILLGFYDNPEETDRRFQGIAAVIQQFTDLVERETGSTSISVNRNVLHFSQSLFLHSECSLTMISAQDYERFLLSFDSTWSERRQSFGVHYCGCDPHRFAPSFAKIPQLDFLDVGWGADLTVLRTHLPDTFFNLRLSPVEFVTWEPAVVEQTVRSLVEQSGDPKLTGVCCINIDDRVRDDQIEALLSTVRDLKRELPPAAED